MGMPAGVVAISADCSSLPLGVATKISEWLRLVQDFPAIPMHRFDGPELLPFDLPDAALRDARRPSFRENNVHNLAAQLRRDDGVALAAFWRL